MKLVDIQLMIVKKSLFKTKVQLIMKLKIPDVGMILGLNARK